MRRNQALPRVAGGSRPYKCYKLLRQHYRLIRWFALSPPTSLNIQAKSLGVSAGLFKKTRHLAETIPPHAWVEAEQGSWQNVEDIIFRRYPGYRLLPGYRRCMDEIQADASAHARAQPADEAQKFQGQSPEQPQIDVATRRAKLGEMLEAWLTPAAIAALLKLKNQIEFKSAYGGEARRSSARTTDSRPTI